MNGASPREGAKRSMTAGLEPYPGVGRPSERPRRRTCAVVLVIGLGAVMAAAWIALGVAALVDYPKAEDYPDPVGAGIEAMLDVVGMVTGAVGALCAAGGAVAWVRGSRLLSVVLFAISGASPVIVAVGLLAWVCLVAS